MRDVGRGFDLEEQAARAAGPLPVVEGDPRELAEGDGQQREVDAGQREAEAEIADDRAGDGGDGDAGEQADPRADAEMEVEAGRDVAAQPGIERVAERELAREAHQDVPGLPDIGEVEHQDQDGEPVLADQRRRREEQRQQHAQAQQDARRRVADQAADETHCAHALAPDQALRAQQQDQDQQAEAEHALERGLQQEARHRFADADQQAAQQRAGHAAEAADDDDDEGEQGVFDGEEGRHRDDGDHQRARGTDAGRADAEGDGIEAAHVEADDQRGEVVVGRGADRLAGARAGEEEPQQQGDGDGGQRRVQAHGVEHQRAQLVGLELRLHLDAARIGTGDGEAGIDQQDGDGQQQQELLVLGPADEGLRSGRAAGRSRRRRRSARSPAG